MESQKIPTFSLKTIRSIFQSSKRIIHSLWHDRRGFIFGFLMILLLISATPFLIAGSRGLLINFLVRDVGQGIVSHSTILALIFLVVSAFLHPILNAFQFYLDRRFWIDLEVKFEADVMKKLGEIDIATHENPEHRNLSTRIKETGLWRLQNFTSRLFYLLQNIIEVVIAAVILGLADWRILIFIALATVPELIAETKYGNYVFGLWSERSEERRWFFSLKDHFRKVSGITELKIFQNSAHFVGLVKEFLISFQKSQQKIERKKILFQLFTITLSQGAIAFSIIWFVFKVLNGGLQIGTLTFLLASIVSLRQSLSGFFSNLGRQYQDGLFVNDIFSLLDTKPVMQNPDPGISLKKDVTPEIEFDNVTFKYPGTTKDVLRDFSLKIPPGEKLAIVGLNGAGKTTLVKLLCRFYDPDKGKVLINGHDIKKIDLNDWYHLLGAIFQDYSNYHFTVKDAIALGRTGKGTDIEKVKRSAKAAEADIFIEDWHEQYNQMLGKDFSGGVEPSIGQWQKLALARTFYRNPRVLILDEPTSSIDAEAEAKIFEKLGQLSSDKTVLLISHRFSTVRQANRICVIENGRAKEVGTHKKLLSLNGIYAKLFRLQAKGYK